jgi:hypothetical protein
VVSEIALVVVSEIALEYRSQPAIIRLLRLSARRVVIRPWDDT